MKLETIVGLWKKIVEPTRGDAVAEAEAEALFEYVVATLRDVERDLAAPVATTRARFIAALDTRREEGTQDGTQATRGDDTV